MAKLAARLYSRAESGAGCTCSLRRSRAKPRLKCHRIVLRAIHSPDSASERKRNPLGINLSGSAFQINPLRALFQATGSGVGEHRPRIFRGLAGMATRALSRICSATLVARSASFFAASHREASRDDRVRGIDFKIMLGCGQFRPVLFHGLHQCRRMLAWS